MIRKFGLWSLTGVLAALSAFQAAAGATFIWKGGEGDWTDASKWYKGTWGTETDVGPGADDITSFTGTNNIIHVNGVVEINELTSDYGKADGWYECTIVGSGKIKVNSTGTSLQINKYARLIMDGPDLEVVQGVNYAEGGEIIIKKGTWTMPYTFYIKTAPGKLVIDGGTLTGTGVLQMQDAWKGASEHHNAVGTFELKSGTLNIRTYLRSGTFNVSGGVWDRSIYAQNTYFPGMFTPENDLYFNITGGDKVLFHASDDKVFDVRFAPVKELVHKTTGNAYWSPFQTQDVETWNSISAPKTILEFRSDGTLAATLLDIYNLYFYKLEDEKREVTLNADVIRINQSGDITIGTTKNENTPLHIVSEVPVRFESDPHGRKVSINSGLGGSKTMAESDAYWEFKKGVTFDGVAKDGQGVTSWNLCAIRLSEGAHYDYLGAQSEAQMYFINYSDEGTWKGTNQNSGRSNEVERVSIGAGGKLTFSNWGWSNRDFPLMTRTLVLGEGAKISTLYATYAHLDANEVTWDASNELLIGTPDLANSNFSPAPIMLGPTHMNDTVHPKVTLTTTGASDNWNFEWINGQPTVWRKDVDPHTASVRNNADALRWRGYKDGNWADAANWKSPDADPSATYPDNFDTKACFDGGYVNTRVTVDHEAKAKWIRVADKTAPLAFVGTGSIELGTTTTSSAGATAGAAVEVAIGSGSDHPVIFDVPVKLKDVDSGNMYFAINEAGRGYIAFTKTVTAPWITIMGDVRVAGTMTAEHLIFYNRSAGYPAKETRLSVLPGGKVEARSQTWEQNASVVWIHIHHDGKMVIGSNTAATDRYWGYNVSRFPIRVDENGLFDCSTCPLGGSNEVAFVGKGLVKLMDTGSKAMVDYYPVTMDGVTFAVKDFTAGHPLVLTGSPTWGAMSDWTYDLDPITLPAGETLTIDTDDIDGNGVHTVTLAAKVTADNLVVKGAGTLKLAVAQDVRAFSFAEGTKLAIDDSILVDGAWTTVLTFPKDATVDVEDLPFDSGKVKVRVIEDDDAVLVQAKPRVGGLLIIR